MPPDAVRMCESDVSCPVCRAAIGADDAAFRCPACQTAYHADCWAYNGGCGVYGCSEGPPTERLESVEIAAAYWGQEEKTCPVCRAKILAAAIRCRYCGTLFDTARPQEAQEFRARGDLERRVQRARRTSIWLLVLGLLPCTAPIVAIVGPIWYITHREPIRRLSAAHAALCVIAVGVACLQTAMTVAATVFYGLFRG
jgi:hypothetical protein